jgi:hypothetical protein
MSILLIRTPVPTRTKSPNLLPIYLTMIITQAFTMHSPITLRHTIHLTILSMSNAAPKCRTRLS